MNDVQANGTGKRREWSVPILLVVCVAVVAFWEIMAFRSRRPFDPFQITAEDFRGFAPSSALWSLRPRSVPLSPTEPNILAYEVRRRSGLGEQQQGYSAPVLVRLVHGYNMCDCMRIKGYTVELVKAVGGSSPGSPSSAGGMAMASAVALRAMADKTEGSAGASRRQVWRLTSSTGQDSIWVTGMIRAGDFRETGVDVRSMAFPRIDIPDDPGWLPRGMTWKSLRHPVDNARSFLRAKWNNSRCDVATFLGLKKPAWADDELLTLVAAWEGEPVSREQEQQVMAQVLSAYDCLYAELRKWRQDGEER